MKTLLKHTCVDFAREKHACVCVGGGGGGGERGDSFKKGLLQPAEVVVVIFRLSVCYS